MKTVGPPLLAFVFGCVVLAAGGLVAGVDVTRGESWSRSDSLHYLDQALHGPTLHRCAEGEEGFHPNAWCGSTGWMSGYPLLIAGCARLGIDPLRAGLAIALTSCLLSLVVLWACFLERRSPLSLAFAGVFPGCIWYHAAFPLAPLALASLLSLHFVRRRRFWLAGLCGFAAGTLYTSAFVLAAVLAVFVLLDERRLAPAALVFTLTALGYVAVLAWQGAHTGAWDGIFRVQARYGFHLSDPFDTLLARLKPLVNRRYMDALRFAWAFQELVTLSLVVGLGVAFVRQGLWREREARLVALYGAAFFAFPLFAGGMVSLHRSDAALLPLAALVPRLPRALQWALLAGAVPVAAFTAALYMTWRLA